MKTMPTLSRHTRTRHLLCLVLTLAQPGLLLAENVVTEDTDLTLTEPCDPGFGPEDRATTSGQVRVNKPGDTCEQPAPELIEEARQELSCLTCCGSEPIR